MRLALLACLMPPAALGAEPELEIRVDDERIGLARGDCGGV